MKLQVVTEIEIPEDLRDFQAVELKIREAIFKSGGELVNQVLDLAEKRCLEGKPYWKKDRREKKYQMLVGEVKRKRWRVWDWYLKSYRYPLDEWLKLKPHQRVSLGLKNEIIEGCVQKAYRPASREIERWTGVKRTPLSNWKLIQGVAKEEKAKEKKVPDWYLKPIPFHHPKMKEDPCPLIAIDPDGTMCRSWKKDEADHDVKMVVMYTGKEPEGNSKKRWKLKERQVLFSRSNETVSDFFNRVSHKAMKHYGAHAQTQVIIHGDGDTWIKGLKINYWDQALMRLDPWHVKKKIRLATGISPVPEEWEQAIYGDPDRLVFMLQSYKLERTAPRSREREKMDELLQYLKNNREGLLPSGVPQEVKEKYPRMFKRGSGTIESHIGHGLADRCKLRRMSWSSQGLDNILYLREKYLNGKPKPKFIVPKPLTRKGRAA